MIFFSAFVGSGAGGCVPMIARNECSAPLRVTSCASVTLAADNAAQPIASPQRAAALFGSRLLSVPPLAAHTALTALVVALPTGMAITMVRIFIVNLLAP